MRRLVTFLSFLILLAFPRVATAQDTGWTIDAFTSDITIQQSGVVAVEEVITVDFYDLSKHGIYRDLPVVYDLDGQKHYTSIDVTQVFRDGQSEKFELITNGSNLRIKIGDANRTISGQHVYRIVYEVTGVLQGYEDHDELYWNVTGNNWSIPIVKVEGVVRLENGQLTGVACYIGVFGSDETCDSSLASGDVAPFSSSRLTPGEGVSIVAGFPKGSVPLLTVARPKTWFEQFVEWPSLITLGVSLVFGIGTVIALWYKNGRDYWFVRKHVLASPTVESSLPFGHHETIVVEYEPPEKLRPAELGVLMDERADTLDVVATIVDLATRGYLTITEVKKKWLFGNVDYLLTRNEIDGKGLLAYEKDLLSRLFDSKKEVKVSSLKRTFYSDLQQVKRDLYKHLVERNVFPKDPDKVRSGYAVLGGAIVVVSIGALIATLGLEQILLTDIFLGAAVSGVVLVLLSPFMSRRSGHGRELYRRARGYRLFVETAEKHRQQFFEKKNLFNEVLPYAIVFGLTEKFAQAMKDIGLPEKQMASGWYYGAQAFNYSNFSASMHDFSKSMSTAITSAPKSSGFSSGGGFSGGGFGGGGGGSW